MSPLSGDDDARANQLANLRRGTPAGGNAGSFRAGHPGPSLRHGGYSERRGPLIMNDAIRQILEEIAKENPALVDEHGEPRAVFIPSLQAAALAAMQIEDLRLWLAKHGTSDERGRYRVSEGQLLDQRYKAYAAALDRLGATPTALARLGLDVARTGRERGDFALWAADEALVEAEADASRGDLGGDASRAARGVVEGEGVDGA